MKWITREKVKVDRVAAKGERTDLVLGTPLEIKEDVLRASDALVLTEWKLVRDPSELAEKAEQAYRQAKRYREGILAGFELASRRYLILISNDHLDVPNPMQEAEATFEYRNVAVSPRPPSAG